MGILLLVGVQGALMLRITKLAKGIAAARF
jgi:hypothetical protein